MNTSSRPTKKQRDDERRAAAAAAKLALARAARRRKIMLVGAVAVAVAIVTTLIVVGVTRSSHPSTTATLPTPVAATGGGTPPWPAPVSPDDNISSAGLRLLKQEGTALHFHAHLDVRVNGTAVPVPADLGINTKTQMISEMHTHDSSGVIHIEAPDASRRYVLGQLFDEWGVRLDASHIGGLAAGTGKTLVAYVNGKPVTGDPAQIELTAHEQITLVYGDAGATPSVAASYAFPAGE